MKQNESSVKRYLMSQLLEQMKSTVKKLEISILDGCFKGLDHYLVSFHLRKSEEYWEDLYFALLKSSDYPEDGGRRYHRRAALNLFARHSSLWSDKLIQPKDCKQWFFNLKIWAQSGNSDVRITIHLIFWM